MMVLLSAGMTYDLKQNVVYALPARACMISSDGRIQISNNGEVFTDFDLINGSGITAARFIKVLEDAHVGIKDYFVLGANQYDASTLKGSYLDLTEAAGTDPALNTARLHSLNVNGFTVVEVRDGAANVVRLASDNIIVAKVVEAAGVARGQGVYISGAAGANPLVSLAKSDNINTMPCVGIILDPCFNQEFSRVLLSGTIQLVDTSMFNEGVSLFVSSTVAGGFTTTLPSPPSYSQRVGFVTRSHAVQGEMLVLTTGIALNQ